MEICGQRYAHNGYATLPDTNSQFMGFSGYQNVNSGSQRDNKFFFCKRIITIQNVSEKYITPQDFLFWGVF